MRHGKWAGTGAHVAAPTHTPRGSKRTYLGGVLSMGGMVRATAMSTAPYGVYEMDSDLAPGTYTTYAAKGGYVSFGRIGIAVTSGATTFADFPLSYSAK